MLIRTHRISFIPLTFILIKPFIWSGICPFCAGKSVCDVSTTKVLLAFALCCLRNTDFESSSRLTAGLNAEWTQDAGQYSWPLKRKDTEVHSTVPDGSSGRLDCNYSFRERYPTVKHTLKAQADAAAFSFLLHFSHICPHCDPAPKNNRV